MTENNAKKEAVRQRMAQTGERYNVARRRVEAAPTPDSHLISDDETRRIAETFFAASPWLGSVTWRDIVAGPGADYLTGWTGAFDPAIKPGDGQRWSWSATFTDPSGQEKTLSHESILEGLRALIFGEELTGVDALRLLRVKQWFTEPAAERRKIELGSDDSSRICQQALYGRQVFSAEDDHLGLEKLDFFSDQRPAHEEE